MSIDNERELFEGFMFGEIGCSLHSKINCADISANAFAWEIWQARANIKADVESEAVAEVKTEEVEYLFDHKLYLHPEQINQALIAYVKELRDALQSVLPHTVTQVIACNGLKCRELVCESCSSDAEESAQIAENDCGKAYKALVIPESLKSILGE